MMELLKCLSQKRLSLAADQARTDFAAIESGFEVIHEQLSRLPTRRELVHRFIQVIQFPPIRLRSDLFRASTKTDEAAAAAVDGRVKPGQARP